MPTKGGGEWVGEGKEGGRVGGGNMGEEWEGGRVVDD